MNQAAMTRRLVCAHACCTPADLAAGLAWYDRAYEAAIAILPNDPERAAGVIAALSPRCTWATNVAWAAAMIDAAERGDTEPPAVHTVAMRKVAWSIATGTPASDALRGPKVSRFYRNIMGDHDAVTIDVWAARAAEGHRDGRAPSGKRYNAIERAYQSAARIVGLSPRDLQAAIWVNIRGRAS